MELALAMTTTAAVRSFTGAEVPDDVLYRILEAARFAPSGGNRQPWRIVVVKDKGLRESIRDAYVLSWREYLAHVEQGLVPFAPGANGRWDGPAVDLDRARAVPRPDDFADHLDTVPVMLVLLVRLSSLAVTDNGLGRQSIVGGASVYPFGHNILLAARAEGLGGVMTTVICREEPRLKELLGIDGELAVAGLITLGHPKHQVTKLKRKSVEEFATVDRFGGEPFSVHS